MKKMVESELMSSLRKERFINLCTFKKNGSKIETPVIFAIDDEKIIISTKSFASKLKRIKNNSKVILFPCDARGNRKGDDMHGIATIIDAQEQGYAYDALRKKNGFIFRLWRLSGKLQGHTFRFITISVNN